MTEIIQILKHLYRHTVIVVVDFNVVDVVIDISFSFKGREDLLPH